MRKKFYGKYATIYKFARLLTIVNINKKKKKRVCSRRQRGTHRASHCIYLAHFDWRRDNKKGRRNTLLCGVLTQKDTPSAIWGIGNLYKM